MSRQLQHTVFRSASFQVDVSYSENSRRQYAAASREIGAFLTAVRLLFGEAEAVLASAEWVALMERMEIPIHNANHNWRYVTVAAASQLATRRLTEQKRVQLEGGGSNE